MSAEAIAAALEVAEADSAASAPGPRRFCFVAGTHIATLRGEMPVEQLREGDHIRAKKGSFHIVTDVTVVEFDDLAPEAQTQVGVYPLKRGAIDEGLPRRDVYVSAGQQFELSRRLEIAHAVRMAVRKEGAALRGFRFVLFTCPGLSMIRAEGVWTTLTPIERAFPAPRPGTEAETPEPESSVDAAPPDVAPSGAWATRPALPEPAPPVVAGPPEPAWRSVAPQAPVPVPPAPAPAPSDAAPLPPTGARAAVATRRATRRPVTRFLRTPVSMPASPHTGTETPDP